MKKRGTKFISLVLAVILTLSCFTAIGFISAGAAGSVYCEDAAGWGTVYCYMWTSGASDQNAEWPGVQMTAGSDGIFSAPVDGSYAKVIFNNGGESGKTNDLDFLGAGKCFNNSTGNWSDYSGDSGDSGNSGQGNTQPATTAPVSGGSDSIYCQNDANWGSVTVYMWNSGSDSNADWPGAKMTDLGDGVFEYTPTKKFKNVIFSENGNNQTGDLTVPSNGNIFNNSTNKWDVYSSSPVKITAFESDIQSPAYTSCSIKLSATAKSAEGGLKYKFTVKGPSGESLLSDGTASTVRWVPNVVGNYTVTVEVSDAAGNTNSRSISFEINDPTKLETAFISAFTNSLNTNTQIKKDTKITFTMNALGGHTGNGLLFYKFMVSDPDGKENVAYYTTHKDYTITPTKLGTYTINAFVQNSDNDTVSGTYTYNCVGEINETPDSTSPAPVPIASDPSSQTDNDEPTQAASSDNDPGQSPTNGQTPDSDKETVPASTNAGSDDVNPAETVADATLGDVNHDGYINVTDATIIQKYVALFNPKNFDPELADTDRNGSINIKDATVIQKYVAKIITTI